MRTAEQSRLRVVYDSKEPDPSRHDGESDMNECDRTDILLDSDNNSEVQLIPQKSAEFMSPSNLPVDDGGGLWFVLFRNFPAI